MKLEQALVRIGAWRRPVAAGVLVTAALIALLSLDGPTQAQPRAPAPGVPSALAAPLPERSGVMLQATHIFSEDFESGLSLWQVSAPVSEVGWNLRSTSQAFGLAHSGSNAMWFGNPIQGQYGGNCFPTEGGCPLYTGDLTYVGAPIPIPTNFTYTLLTFQSWSLTEMSFPWGCAPGEAGTDVCSYDLRQVWISSTTDSNWQLKWSTNQNPTIERQWRPVGIDLAEYTGKSIRIRFTFNTNDPNHNPGDDSGAYKPAGWFVDLIWIYAFTPSSRVYLPIVRK